MAWTPALPALLLSLSNPVAAGVVTVGPPGSGAAFEDIQSAIDASLPGDTIRVAEGSYAPFDLDKGLTIVGAGPTATIVEVAPGVSDAITAHIHDVPAGFAAIVMSVGLRGAPTLCFLDPCAATVVVRDCEASVVLHDVDVEDVDPEENSELILERNGRVVLSRLDVTGIDDLAPAGSSYFRPAIQVDQTSLTIVESRILGGRASSGPGQDAIEVEGSTLEVVRSEVRGGRGGTILTLQSVGQPGGAGIVARSSTVVLDGGPGSVIGGGDGGLYFGFLPGGPGAGASAVEALSGASVRWTSVDLVFEPGATPNGPTAPPVFVGSGASSTVFHAPSASLGFGAGSAPLGGTALLDARGEPLDLLLLFLTVSVGPDVLFAGVEGVFHLAAIPLLDMGIYTLDGNGQLSLPLAIPPNPNLVGLPVVMQAIEVDLAGSRWTNPAMFAVGA